MAQTSIAKYLKLWLLKAEKSRQRVEALRIRDGENCRRCRRPMRFDLPAGHDRAPSVQQIQALANGGAVALDNLCLTHGRCNAEAGDNTHQVQERVQLRQQEAAKPRKRRKPARAAA